MKKKKKGLKLNGGITYKNISDGYFGGSIGSIAVQKATLTLFMSEGAKSLEMFLLATECGNLKMLGRRGRSLDCQNRHTRVSLLISNRTLSTAVLGNIYKPTEERGFIKVPMGGKLEENAF